MKLKLTNSIFEEVSKFAEKEKVELYVVGGYVRDLLMERPNKDIDFTIVGDAVEFSIKLAKYFKTKAVVYERFRTAMVPYKGYQLEFVGTRKEVYEKGSRNPIVSEGTFYDDIKRRDFTVNAMAISLNKDNFGELQDFFEGISDLENKILRTPLEPETTYSDDPLRMMRAFRFASQLGFTIVDESIEAITKLAKRIEIISIERISIEFLKIIASNNPTTGLLLLQKTGIMQYIFPEIANLTGVDIKENNGKKLGHKDVFKHSVKVLSNISKKTDDLWLRFASLVHDIGKPKTKKFIEGIGWSFHGHEEIGARMIKKIFRRMHFPMEHLSYVEKLVRMHQRPMVLIDDGVSDSAIRRLAAQAGSDLEDLFTLVRADITTRYIAREERYKNNYEVIFQKILDVQEKDKLREFQSPVRGEEIMKLCGIAPCKAVGIIKSNIEEAILDGNIPNEYEESKQYFLENKGLWLLQIKEENDKFLIIA